MAAKRDIDIRQYSKRDKSLSTENKRMFSRKCTSDDWLRARGGDIAYDEVIASVNYFINIERHQQIVPTFGSAFIVFFLVFDCVRRAHRCTQMI